MTQHREESLEMRSPSSELVVFSAEGHLTDEAVTSLADGAGEVLGLAESTAMAHLDVCEACSGRLGDAALASMAVATVMRAQGTPQELAHPSVVRPIARARRPLPWFAIAAALLVAVVSAGPSLIEGAGGIRQALVEAIGVAPLVGRMAVALLRAPWWEGHPLLFAVQLATAGLFVGIGVRVARAASRVEQVEAGGGVR